VRIINKTKNIVIAENGRVADTVLSRLVGLLNQRSISPEEALVITECRSIHMFFMRFSIDVIFVDRKNKVVGLVQKIRPFRMSPYFFRAQKAIEIFPGGIKKSQTMVGDEITFSG
jgi:uncharacterized protein